MRYLLSIILILCWTGAVESAPVPSTATQNIVHGGTITVEGSSFGAKTPAAPLMWDDCESETANSLPSLVTPVGGSRVAYSAIEPPLTGSADHQTRYRAIPYTPVGATGNLTTVTSGPHSRSTQILSGGHENGIGGDSNDGANQAVVIPNTNGQGSYASDWTVMYYWRLNSDWPTCGSSNNFKFQVWSEDADSMWGNSNDWIYFDTVSSFPCQNLGYVEFEATNRANVSSVDHGGAMPDTNSTTWDKVMGWRASAENNSPRDGWVKYEMDLSDDLGFIKISIDNAPAWWGSSQPNWYTATSVGIGSVSVGGYFRQTLDNIENDDAHRMYDDIYVDDTLSHIVLTNASTYDASTIVEPQIPTAWESDGTEVTATVNLGALPDNSTAWLYVFDSVGDYNTTGVAVTIGDSAASTYDWCLDADGDNYYTGSCVNQETDPGTGWELLSSLTGGSDCNDSAIGINPGATDICGNGIAEDCVADVACPVTGTITAYSLTNGDVTRYKLTTE